MNTTAGGIAEHVGCWNEVDPRHSRTVLRVHAVHLERGAADQKAICGYAGSWLTRALQPDRDWNAVELVTRCRRCSSILGLDWFTGRPDHASEAHAGAVRNSGGTRRT